MSDELMSLWCPNCKHENGPRHLQHDTYCQQCGRMLPVELYYENLGTAGQPKWGRPLWQAQMEDNAHAAGAAEERARIVAVIEAEIKQTAPSLAGRVRVGALNDILAQVRQ